MEIQWRILRKNDATGSGSPWDPLPFDRTNVITHPVHDVLVNPALDMEIAVQPVLHVHPSEMRRDRLLPFAPVVRTAKDRIYPDVNALADLNIQIVNRRLDERSHPFERAIIDSGPPRLMFLLEPGRGIDRVATPNLFDIRSEDVALPIGRNQVVAQIVNVRAITEAFLRQFGIANP